jgi:hypothetical protein
MANIRIKFKDGSVKTFNHQGRPGGSYTKKLEYRGAFVVVIDEYYHETSFPASDIEQINVTPHIGY